MRERISMKSKMLGALALFTLIGALFVMQSADQYTPTADAATGSIDALNVGTCLTTDATVFKGNCEDADKKARLSGGSGSGEWEIREKITEVTTLYATYAHDPKTSGDAPRAILNDADLLKISIADSGRDKRTGVLIRGASNSDTITDDDTSGLGFEIREDLKKDKLDYQTHDPDTTDPNDTTDDDVIKFSSEDSVGDGIEVHLQRSTDSSIADNSGNFTLNFSRSGSPEIPPNVSHDDWQFDPGDFDVDGGAVVRFYGCVDVKDDEDCGDETDGSDDIKNLKDFLSVDEDASNGEASGDTAPWLGINASVPSGKEIVILAVYYRTSDHENLVGGQKYCTATDAKGVDDDGICPDDKETKNDDDTRNSAADVDYTTDEQDKNTALIVQASADGDLEKRIVNLNLKEAKRFSGVYQGCIRLTDANGDGQDPGATPPTTKTTDWGREVMDGSAAGADCAGAAVLAVDQGPVIIEYRDSDDKKQTLRIEIDNVAPTITVTSPAHGSSSDDQSPDFAGTLEDAASGLVDKSFRLVADNKIDGAGKNVDFVLTGKAPAINVTAGTLDNITRISDYMGFGTTADAPPQFGIVSSASALYDLGDDSCDNREQCHILADEYDDGATRGTFDDDLRLDLQDGKKDAVTQDKEFQVDFQAFVMDMAGNIGFSDSDPSTPHYINDLGTKETETKKRKPGNVLGYYSAHIITLDEKDPEIIEEKSATGYYGLNSDDKAIADRFGIMVEFDGPIAESSVSTNTFTVELDDKSMASVVNVDVKKQYVFLKLASELKSDATPMIDIASGEKVEDLAGNETFGKEQDAFDLQDGISPKLTVTLSGGSGSGTGDEGPAKLTKDQITVNVSSDEALQGAPRISVVCSTLEWNEGKDDSITSAIEGSADLIGKDIDDYIENRSGAFSGNQPDESVAQTLPKATKADATAASRSYKYTCGYDEDDDRFDDQFVIVTPATALARAGENWDYTWKNPDGVPGHNSTAFKDDKLTVVAFARDRSRYDHGKETNVQNWGSASTEFTLDTQLLDPSAPTVTGGVQPADGGVSKETRPFVLIDFTDIESTQVTLDSVKLDDVEIASEFDDPETNQFVYWPDSISKGKHEIEAEATDAAGNEVSFDFKFTVEARGDFLIKLLAGWNAVSVPADPVDTTIGSVFTNPAITTVIGWDTQGWRIAVRRDGVWNSNDKIGEPLNEIRAKYGYWVKSSDFIDQPVALTANERGVDGLRIPFSIDTKDGWNFVGVIDQDGDQTEGDAFGESLKGSDDVVISAGEYLGSKYVRAYTWDPTFSNFEVLRPDVAMTIGDGVWVYYEGGIAP